MERMKIAFYTDAYLPGVDGVVSSILTFRDELSRRGHTVYIFASSVQKHAKTADKNTFLYSGLKFKPYPQYNIALFPFNSVLKINELGIDIIHAQTPMVMGFAGFLSARMLRKPFVSSFHTLVTNERIVNTYYPKNKHIRKLAKSSMKRYIEFFYKNSDAVIVPSPSVCNMLMKLGIKNISTIPNCIDTKVFNPKVSGMGFREAIGFGSSEKIILYQGRLSREKNIEVLLRAARILMKKDRGIRLVIGGTGPAEHHYKILATKLGIIGNTRFLGFVDQKMLPKVYAAADVFCLPSTFETQGIVLLEAMASGKPVVGADYLAIKNLISNGSNGEKFRPGDYTDCARKIEKVLNNTGRYKQNAISVAAEYSKEKVAEKLIDVYKRVLSSKAIY